MTKKASSYREAFLLVTILIPSKFVIFMKNTKVFGMFIYLSAIKHIY